ncbi:MAG: hypothetical protein M0P97_02240, partial [Candidatus Moranbacteria bacterium]|nr:hypothetical protein [Candidatus Moranbacteria bacterium]
MKNQVSRNILATLCYYDCLNYPLTSFEIWKYLIHADYCNIGDDASDSISLAEIVEQAEDEELRRVVDLDRGFYFLKGRKGLVDRRLRGNKTAILKTKKMRKFIWFLRFVPFVRMIGVTGRLAMKTAQSKSDWDLLVVLRSGRIWTGRTFFTIASHLMGKRRYGKKIKDRLCLNYFITEKTLEITNKDLFSANEYFFMFPVFDSGSIFEKFQSENSWIKRFHPNYYLARAENYMIIKDGWLSSRVRWVLEKAFNWNWLEEFLEKIEKKKIMNNPKTREKGSLIEASGGALIFLPQPQGPKIF